MHMTSVSGHDQDIFISYAHVDDERFDAGGPDNNLAGRVFVVERAPLADDAVVPQGLTGRRNHRFWYLDGDKKPRAFAKPMSDEDEIQYYRQVEDLARDIH
jgi:hypothetical protein